MNSNKNKQIINFLSKLNYSDSKYSVKGFTLIELLVVIAIIGLLASVVLVALNNSRQKSRDTKRVADMNQLLKGFELYFNQNYTYPTMAANGALSALVGQPPLVPNYLSKLPTTITPADGTCQNGVANGNNDYFFYANGLGNVKVPTYSITFCLGSQVGSLSAGPHTLTQAGFR